MYYCCVCSGQGVWLINHGLGDKLTAAHTDQLIASVISSDDDGAYITTYICMYVTTYACTYTHGRMYARTYTHKYTTHARVCVSVCLCVCVHV